MHKLDAYNQWREGEITAFEAAAPVAEYLAEVLERKAAIEAEVEIVRGMLSELVEAHGRPIKAGGYKLELTAPSVTTSYPKADIEHYLLWLLENNHEALATKLQQLAKHSMRAGSLRVTKDKER